MEKASEKTGTPPEYGISDGVHNLVGGFKDAGIDHHLDISHTLGNCMKHVYGKDPEFMAVGVCVDSVAYLETLCKCEGFGLRTNALASTI